MRFKYKKPGHKCRKSKLFSFKKPEGLCQGQIYQWAHLNIYFRQISCGVSLYVIVIWCISLYFFFFFGIIPPGRRRSYRTQQRHQRKINGDGHNINNNQPIIT